jgi:hypothetical protein
VSTPEEDYVSRLAVIDALEAAFVAAAIKRDIETDLTVGLRRHEPASLAMALRPPLWGVQARINGKWYELVTDVPDDRQAFAQAKEQILTAALEWYKDSPE